MHFEWPLLEKCCMNAVHLPFTIHVHLNLLSLLQIIAVMEIWQQTDKLCGMHDEVTETQ